MPRKNEDAFVLKLFFRSQDELNNYVKRHFDRTVVADKENCFDQLNLRQYTKRVSVLRSKEDMSCCAHYWILPSEDGYEDASIYR